MQRNVDKKRILLTGGHAGTTAYAYIQKLNQLYPNKYKTYFIGSVNAFEGKNIRTSESQILSRLKCVFIPITTGRIQRIFTFWTLPSLMKIPLSFIQSSLIIYKIKPDLILSFGGHAAVPVVVIGKMFSIPIIIHEQTSSVGRANKLCGRCANVIALSRSESKRYFRKRKTVLVGNPVPEEYLKIIPKTSRSSSITILITGGSRGSVFINEVVETVIEELLTKYHIIHTVGQESYKHFIELKKQLGKKANCYEVYSFLPPEKFSKLIEKSDIVVSRSGANSVSQFTVARRPAIYIPLPISYLNEQFLNAKLLEKVGAAVIIQQRDLDGACLLKTIQKVINNRYEMVNANTLYFIKLDSLASQKLVNLTRKYIK